MNKITMIYTIIAVVSNSLFLHLTESWHIASNELMVNAIFGGIFVGCGIGLIIRVGGTTAGTTKNKCLAPKQISRISMRIRIFGCNSIISRRKTWKFLKNI